MGDSRSRDAFEGICWLRSVDSEFIHGLLDLGTYENPPYAWLLRYNPGYRAEYDLYTVCTEGAI